MKVLFYAVLSLILSTALAGSNECGIPGPSSRIVGGHEATPGQWPWMAFFKIKGKRGFNLCGASILSPDWVLTAAHCVGEMRALDRYSITVGEHDYMKLGEKYEVEHDIKQIIVHPLFKGGRGNYYDIAMLRMTKPISFNSHVRPICLPNANDNHEGQKCHIAGWGVLNGDKDLTDKLMTVSSDVWSYKKCRVKWGEVQRDYQYCFGNGVVGSCAGDSGGPIMCSGNDGRYRVVGLASFGPFKCDNPHTPSVFTRVSRYVPWIKDILSGGSGKNDRDITLAEGVGTKGRCTMKTPACHGWKEDGKCKGSDINGMIRQCTFVCGLCENCKDKDGFCSLWAQMGRCNSGDSILLKCAKSCGLCN